MKMQLLTATLGLALTFTLGCEEGSFTDNRDGKTYKQVKIGTQIWMAENLNTDIQGSGCYEDNPENCKKYGRLYSYETAMQACPKGWHLPSDKEWQILIDFADGWEVAARKLKSKSGWKEDRGIDEYGFSALPGGNSTIDGYFLNVGEMGFWWSATEHSTSEAYSLDMNFHYAIVLKRYNPKTLIFSVRCVQN